jgi:hypothetical protein
VAVSHMVGILSFSIGYTTLAALEVFWLDRGVDNKSAGNSLLAEQEDPAARAVRPLSTGIAGTVRRPAWTIHQTRISKSSQ